MLKEYETALLGLYSLLDRYDSRLVKSGLSVPRKPAVIGSFAQYLHKRLPESDSPSNINLIVDSPAKFNFMCEAPIEGIKDRKPKASCGYANDILEFNFVCGQSSNSFERMFQVYHPTLVRKWLSMAPFESFDISLGHSTVKVGALNHIEKDYEKAINEIKNRRCSTLESRNLAKFRNRLEYFQSMQ